METLQSAIGCTLFTEPTMLTLACREPLMHGVIQSTLPVQCGDLKVMQFTVQVQPMAPIAKAFQSAWPTMGSLSPQLPQIRLHSQHRYIQCLGISQSMRPPMTHLVSDATMADRQTGTKSRDGVSRLVCKALLQHSPQEELKDQPSPSPALPL